MMLIFLIIIVFFLFYSDVYKSFKFVNKIKLVLKEHVPLYIFLYCDCEYLCTYLSVYLYFLIYGINCDILTYFYGTV